MSYEFTVTYGEDWKCISAEFPNASAKIPEAEPFPGGQVLKIVLLGRAMLTYEQNTGEEWKIICPPGRTCGHPIPPPSPGKEVAITFDGDGVVVRVAATGGFKIAAEKSISLASAEVKGLKETKPLGELLFFKMPDGKITRCLHFQGIIVKSPPSDN